MKILFFGDVVGQTGTDAVVSTLPKWRKAHKPDLVIVNAENSDPDQARGARRPQLDQLLKAGADFLTLGDHFRDMSADDFEGYPMVRPANLTGDFPGIGSRVTATVSGLQVLVISLAGNAFMKLPINNYFKAADAILAGHSGEKLDAIFVDFHTEATSEIGALGHYLDGLVTAVVGTHTHVSTADNRVLPKGTAFQSDVGMCGGLESVIGFDKDNATRWLHRELGDPLERENPQPAGGSGICDAVLITSKTATQAISIERLTTRPKQP